MSNCIISNGYTLGCASIGGVEKVWIGPFSGDTSYTFDADNIVDSVTSALAVYEFEQDMEYAGLTQTGVFERSNGTVHYESVLSLKFIELDADLRNTIVALGKAPVYAVIKSNAGHYYILGVESAGRATNAVASVGVAMSDLNGATMEITFKSQNGAYLIDGTLVGTSIPVA